jgi:catechol 2,3-dioxygenase-like lactoylglutathione lyase family enzyme
MAEETALARDAPVAVGVPGARRVDHVALTVPDLDVAVAFVVDALGGELIYRLPELTHQDDWMRRHLDVHPRAGAEIALLRLGPTTNLELFQYRSPDHNAVPPRTIDAGATHLALFVEDVDAAAAVLHTRFGLPVLGEPRTVAPPSPAAGIRWVRLTAPWGMPLELRSAPSRLPYEHLTAARRFGPCPRWSNHDDGAPAPTPVPGLRNVDHVAYTVADLDAALGFFVGVLGGELLYRTESLLADPLLAAALGVPAEGRMAHAALRMGPTDTVELTCYQVPGAGRVPPRNSDVGGRHLALHVDDVDAAAAYLAAQPGCTVLGGPETITQGPIAGDRWVYVRTPLGLHIELVRMPDGALPYERDTTARRRAAGPQLWSDR